MYVFPSYHIVTREHQETLTCLQTLEIFPNSEVGWLLLRTTVVQMHDSARTLQVFQVSNHHPYVESSD